MLTGYVNPTLRRSAKQQKRSIDVGYRGSVQPLSFGRLAYDKRRIGDLFLRHAKGSGLICDISSRWEDRLGGDDWLEFLRSCRATLGCGSGASVFDLDGSLSARCRDAESDLGPFRLEEDYAAAYLDRLSDSYEAW